MALVTVTQVYSTALSKVAFMDHAYTALGGALVGITRYGTILQQAQASASPAVLAALERFKAASVMEKPNTALFLDILVADSGIDLTQAERDTLIDDWPA